MIDRRWRVSGRFGETIILTVGRAPSAQEFPGSEALPWFVAEAAIRDTFSPGGADEMTRVVYEVERALSPFASIGRGLSREWFAGALECLCEGHALGRLHILRVPRPKWVVSFAPPEELPSSSTPSEAAEVRRFLELDHRYHDDSPVVGAPFKVFLEDGSEVEGTLDGEGKARIEVPARPIEVRYGPDARPWEARKERKSSKYRESLSDAEIEALVQSRFGRA